MATYVGLKEFSEIVGCSKANITQCIKRNDSRIVYIKDDNGKILIDSEKSLENWSLGRNIHLKDQKEEKTTSKKENKNKSKKATVYPIEANQNEKIKAIQPSNYQGIAKEDLDINEVKTLEIVANVAKKTMEVEVMRGNLIQKDILDTMLSNLLTTIRTNLEIIPARISSSLAVKFKDKYSLEVSDEDLTVEIRNSLEDDIKKVLIYIVEENNKILAELEK
ncbi:hypothetical protein [Brachyspira hyodysenteriae]|uniref:hypothetical protein n=2 Tax=Brachyspira hyodysenteriae TaxID=159 RepID=UPI00063DC507|nr:hypothetical protein [Brachyspira hyodysenteriae]KLI46141.1 hypothetical protein SZ41_12295 [Brachyspira hyodysenteriae]KLI53618.1 hypothetical protein SZ42_00570 [Brachyspira hyodysenteriae]